MTRVMGLDLGTKRIGVAVSNGTLATPLTTIERSGDVARDYERIAALAAEEEATHVVVGVPINMDGTTGPAAQAALEEVDSLRSALPATVTIDTIDERLTTVTADRALRSAHPRSRVRGRRRTIDQTAAAVILQAWIDRESQP